jgi:NAD(P)-dependent dehydrogenase (short-subunit alcohol dehydrogenase family)
MPNYKTRFPLLPAGPGIGRAAALALARAGAKVVVAGRRESEGQAVVHGSKTVVIEVYSLRRIISFAKGGAFRKPNESPYAPEVRTYAQLQRQIHHALRAQHSEWIQPDGDCPMCDATNPV